MDERDILEKLMDFERCGLTPGTRVSLRECAAVEIFKLRQEIEQLRKANSVPDHQLDASSPAGGHSPQNLT